MRTAGRRTWQRLSAAGRLGFDTCLMSNSQLRALQGGACALPSSLPGVDSAPLGGWGFDLLSLVGAGAAGSLGQASPHSHSQGAPAWSRSCSALVGAEAKAALPLGATWPIAMPGASGCGASMSAAAGGALGGDGGSLGGGAATAVLGKKLRERALSMPDLTRCRSHSCCRYYQACTSCEWARRCASARSPCATPSAGRSGMWCQTLSFSV